MIKGELLRRHRRVVEEFMPVLRVVRWRRYALERQVDHVLETGEVGGDLLKLGAAVVVLPAVGVAAGADQDRWLELPEPVQRAAPAEVGGDARPDRPDARGGEHR